MADLSGGCRAVHTVGAVAEATDGGWQAVLLCGWGKVLRLRAADVEALIVPADQCRNW